MKRVSARPRRTIARRHRELLDELRNAYQAPLTGSVPGIGCPFAEGIRVRIEEWDGRWWLVYEPYTWVELPRDDGNSSPHLARSRDATSHGSDPRLAAADWRRERWAQRYNRQWNEILAGWARLIVPEREMTLSAHYFSRPGINAVFRVSSVTAWSSSAVTQLGDAR